MGLTCCHQGLEVSGWPWSTVLLSALQGRPGRDLRERPPAGHSRGPWSPLQSGALLQWKHDLGPQCPPQLTHRPGRQVAVGAQPTPAPNRGPCLHLQGPEVPGSRGDWLPRGTSAGALKGHKAESRVVLQKLRAAATPPQPHVCRATAGTDCCQGRVRLPRNPEKTLLKPGVPCPPGWRWGILPRVR